MSADASFLIKTWYRAVDIIVLLALRSQSSYPGAPTLGVLIGCATVDD